MTTCFSWVATEVWNDQKHSLFVYLGKSNYVESAIVKVDLV